MTSDWNGYYKVTLSPAKLRLASEPSGSREASRIFSRPSGRRTSCPCDGEVVQSSTPTPPPAPAPVGYLTLTLEKQYFMSFFTKQIFKDIRKIRIRTCLEIL